MAGVVRGLPFSYLVPPEGRAGVELLVAECDWQPRRPGLAPDQTVGFRIAFAETAVRDRVKQAGGTWNPDRKVWRLRHDRVLALGLNDRIVDEPASSDGCRTRTDENLRPDAPTTSRWRCSHPRADVGVLLRMTALQSNSS
jgi:hypothetical protein